MSPGKHNPRVQMSIFRDTFGVWNMTFCLQMLLIIPFPGSHRQTHRSERIALGVRGPKGNGLEREFSVWDYLAREKSSGVGGQSSRVTCGVFFLVAGWMWGVTVHAGITVVSMLYLQHHCGDSPCPWGLQSLTAEFPFCWQREH